MALSFQSVCDGFNCFLMVYGFLIVFSLVDSWF